MLGRRFVMILGAVATTLMGATVRTRPTRPDAEARGAERSRGPSQHATHDALRETSCLGRERTASLADLRVGERALALEQRRCLCAMAFEDRVLLGSNATANLVCAPAPSSWLRRDPLDRRFDLGCFGDTASDTRPGSIRSARVSSASACCMGVNKSTRISCQKTTKPTSWMTNVMSGGILITESPSRV
jgi:hypothetical protein